MAARLIGRGQPQDCVKAGGQHPAPLYGVCSIYSSSSRVCAPLGTTNSTITEATVPHRSARGRRRTADPKLPIVPSYVIVTGGDYVSALLRLLEYLHSEPNTEPRRLVHFRNLAENAADFQGKR